MGVMLVMGPSMAVMETMMRRAEMRESGSGWSQGSVAIVRWSGIR